MAGFQIVQGFPEHLRSQAAELYFDAFAGKIGTILGGRQKGCAFFADILDPAFCLCAITPEGNELLGLAGFKTSQGALTRGGYEDVRRHYGWFGGLWRGTVLEFLERELEPKVFLMDGIAVTGRARGLGIGTALLDALESTARASGAQTIRLDVIDTNPRARVLYERRGFEAVSQENLGPLKWVFGFSRSTRMEKRIEAGSIDPASDRSG